MYLRNLDLGVRIAFEQRCVTRSFPTHQSLIDFIEESCKTHELVSHTQAPPAVRKLKTLFTHKTDRSSSRSSNKYPNFKIVCQFSKESHKLYACPKFLALDYNGKRELVQSSRRCFRCLGSHLIEDCRSTGSCKQCGRMNHHTLLHR